MWQFFLKLYPLPHGSARAAQGFAGFCHFTHEFTPGHSLREILLNPFVCSPGEKSQGMPEAVPSCQFAVLAVDVPLIPKNECWEGRMSPTGFSCRPPRALAARSDPRRASGSVCSSLRAELCGWNVNWKPGQPPVSVSTLNLNICEMNVWLWPSRV